MKLRLIEVPDSSGPRENPYSKSKRIVTIFDRHTCWEVLPTPTGAGALEGDHHDKMYAAVGILGSWMRFGGEHGHLEFAACYQLDCRILEFVEWDSHIDHRPWDGAGTLACHLVGHAEGIACHSCRSANVCGLGGEMSQLRARIRDKYAEESELVKGLGTEQEIESNRISSIALE